MPDTDKEWYTYEELAELWNVSLQKVQAAARVLIRTGTIKVRSMPSNMKYREVHRDSIAALRLAIIGE